MADSRVSKDSMGEVRVPEQAHWGASTQRALENFTISGQHFDPRLIRALGLVKRAAARTNKDLGLLPEKLEQAITQAQIGQCG